METLFLRYEATPSFYTVDFTVSRMSRQSSFENLGVNKKWSVEPGISGIGPLFSDVISAMSRELKRLGAGIHLHAGGETGTG